VSRLVEDHGLPVVIVNPSTPVGPRDVKPTPTGRMIVQAARGRMPAFVDTGLNVVHVDDVAAGHLLAFDKGIPGQHYILGGTNLTLRQILQGIAHIRGHRPPRLSLPHGSLLPVAIAAEAWARVTKRQPLVTRDALTMARKRMYFASHKAETELGYAARPVHHALRDAIAWFQNQGYLGRPR
jgi:dihydroflavonol-4-reductase